MFENYEKYLEFLNLKLQGFFENQKPYIFCKKGCAKCCKNAQFPFSCVEVAYLTSKLKTLDENIILKASEFPIVDRYSTGSQLTKQIIETAYIVSDITKAEDIDEVEETTPEPISLQSVDERIMTIDDFLDNFDLEEN